MPDLESRADIDVLMVNFYRRAMTDEVIGHFFTEVVKLDLDHHLPIIGDFWETALFGATAYRRHGRNPLAVHVALHELSPLRAEDFERWLEIFRETVDASFAGMYADFAKQRAGAIARRIREYIETQALATA
jgi:hemoglobin